MKRIKSMLSEIPYIGKKVWFLAGQFGDKVKKGEVVLVSDIDNKGLTNTYVDIESDGKTHHVNLDQVFDHRPKRVKVKDEYGETEVWR